MKFLPVMIVILYTKIQKYMPCIGNCIDKNCMPKFKGKKGVHSVQVSPTCVIKPSNLKQYYE